MEIPKIPYLASCIGCDYRGLLWIYTHGPDFSGTMTPNLHHLKAAALKEVAHLTMIIILDNDHTHYSDAFGNIFEEDTLRKK